MRPDRELADIFGVVGDQFFIREGYITMNLSDMRTGNIHAESLQFHGEGDLYRNRQAEVIAWFSGSCGQKTGYPAIFVNDAGKGKAAAFAYDLAASVVLFHQGLKENASTGSSPDTDGDAAYKPNDLFYGYLDERLKNIPQADIHQDILVNLIKEFLPLPVPRAWHFPDATPAAALIDGDSDGMAAEAMDRVMNISEEGGAKYTLYIMTKDFNVLSRENMKRLMEKGHDFGVHFWEGNRLPPPDAVKKNMRVETEGFLGRYKYSPVASRGHSVIWVGWTEHADFLVENGVRLDCNFAAGPGYQEGYVNGSGLPVKFIDENGRVIDLYEQATISTDDGWMFDKCLLPAKTEGKAIADSLRQIDDLALKYHGVYHPYFHPGTVHEQKNRPFKTDFWMATVIKYASHKGIYFVNGREWVEFNDARRNIRCENLSWDEEKGSLSFTILNPAGKKGITILLPICFEGRHTSPELVDGKVEAKTVFLEGKEQLALVDDGSPKNKITVVYRSAGG